MKVLVITDSHGVKSYVMEAVSLESPEMILHLGDNDRDCSDITMAYPEIPLRTVRGNSDHHSTGLDSDEFVLGGKRILMTHGHLFRVKTGLMQITDFAVTRGVDILLFGHTHTAHYSTVGSLTIINPGSIMERYTYAVLTFKDGVVECDIKTLR